MPEAHVPRRTVSFAAVAITALTLLAACGSDSDSTVEVGSSAVSLVADGTASSVAAPTTIPAETVPPSSAVAAAGSVETTAPASPATAAPAPTPTAAATPVAAAPSGARCMMRLHGLTGDGQDTRVSGGITTLYPRGNAKWNEGNGYGWVYYDDERFPGATYNNALAKVTAALEGVECGQIIVYGFSNGGAMAAKMYCRGETLGGRVIGYVVDDPVTDAGVDGCTPAAGVKVAVFHSQFMDNQTKGNTQCRPGNSWICENNIRYLLSDYGNKIGTAGKIVAKDHDAGPYEPVVASWWQA